MKYCYVLWGQRKSVLHSDRFLVDIYSSARKANNEMSKCESLNNAKEYVYWVLPQIIK